MEIDIRNNIITNLKNMDKKDIIETISSSIASKDELILPGLGVILELIWNEYSQKEQEYFAELVIKKINHH